MPSYIFPFLFSKWNQSLFLKALKRIGIDVANVAVCHVHTPHFVACADSLKRINPKCLTLLHHHDLMSFGLNHGRLHHVWLYNVIQFPILRFWYERVDLHVFISEATRKSFLMAPDTSWTDYEDYRKQMRGLGFYRSVKPKQSVVLHNGVDVTFFNPLCEKTKKSDVFTIGCIGNFTKIKDQLTLLRALSIISTELGAWQVKFVGDGSELEKCVAFVKEHELTEHVLFEPAVDHTQLPSFYHSLDLFVLPSYLEGFGCVFTEAWACGVPFITCKGQGVDDLILEEEREIWLCQPHNPKDLAAKILRYYNERPVQHLSKPIEIDVLVKDFLKTVAECHHALESSQS